MDLNEGARRFTEVCERWDEVHKRARDARLGLTSDFMACAAGNGSGPLMENIKRTEALEAEARKLEGEMAAIIKETFG